MEEGFGKCGFNSGGYGFNSISVHRGNLVKTSPPFIWLKSSSDKSSSDSSELPRTICGRNMGSVGF